jgi:CheY-like chemotaxis protein
MHLPPVLIVEDDPDSRNMLAALLGLHGYRTVTAANGVEALELARRERPAVILLDLMMPVMDGPAFRRAQLGDPSLAAIPIVVLSAHLRTAELARELGASTHLVKPFDLDQLLRAITSAQAPADGGRTAGA